MSKISQKDAVFEAISLCKDETGSFVREKVVDRLVQMFHDGRIHIESENKKSSSKAIREYMGSIISHWTKKDTRYVGDTFSASRKTTKPVDDEMKRLMKAKVLLLSQGQSTDEIDIMIELRQREILTQKTDDRSAIEEEARKLLGI